MHKTKPEKVSWKENFIQYLVNSTLHGLKYVGEVHISYFERGFFICSILFVFTLSAYFISNIWAKWTASPIIITLNAMTTSLDEFPFPAVTICNMNQAQRSSVRHVKIDTVEYSFLQNLCLHTINTTNAKDSVGKWPQFRRFILEVSQPCEQMMLYCRYGTETFECLVLFNSVLTDEGLCCIFNGIHPKFLLKSYNDSIEFGYKETERYKANDWTPEKGFIGSTSNTYPRPSAGPGSQLGLFLILNANLREYFCSSTNSVGFKLLLHNPIEAPPRITDYGIMLSTGYETRITVTPILSGASRVIQKVPIHARQCIFENENMLSYYRTYSRRNCENECEARIYDRACKCVLYYMPRISQDVTICGQSDWNCVLELKSFMQLNRNSSYACNCLPACSGLTYEAEISMAPLITNGMGFNNEFLQDNIYRLATKDLAIAQIYFRDSFFRSQTKEELIGLTEFLSNTGGLLGLFMGFSVVSIIEVVYFITLRPYCANYRYKKRHRLWNKNMKNPSTAASRNLSYQMMFDRLKLNFPFNNQKQEQKHYPYID